MFSFFKCFSCVALVSVFVVGCSTDYHRSKADQQVYEILKQTRKQVFKKNADFSIDTRYSKLDPQTIKSSQILDETRSGGSYQFSIDDALEYAAKHSRDYQSEKEHLYLTALSLTGARQPYAPNASSSAMLNGRRTSDGEVIGSAAFKNSVSQAFLAGGSYSLVLANDLLKYFTGDPRRSASSVVSFNIVKPLLRGAGRDVAAENLTQANRNVIYAIRDYTNFQHEFSRDIVLQYFRLLQQKESVHNELQNYKSRQANTAYLKARSVDRASSQEVGDSEQGELQAKNRWINAQARYQTSLDDFKLRLGMPTTAKLTLEDKELNRLVSVGLHPVHLSSKEAFHIALNNRLPLMNEIDQFDDTKRQIKIAANQLKAGLDFTGRVSLPSGDNRLDHLDFNDLSSQVGLELSLPINQQHERNSYRRALIHFEANIRSLSRAYDRLNNQIKQRIRQIDQYKKNYEIQKGAVELALKRVEENRLRMLAGTLIFRRLSESQDALIHAQNAVTNALIDYQQARLELFTDIGILDSSSSGYWLKAKPTKKYNE